MDTKKILFFYLLIGSFKCFQNYSKCPGMPWQIIGISTKWLVEELYLCESEAHRAFSQTNKIFC
jgi:hypothetical protein